MLFEGSAKAHAEQVSGVVIAKRPACVYRKGNCNFMVAIMPSYPMGGINY